MTRAYPRGPTLADPAAEPRNFPSSQDLPDSDGEPLDSNWHRLAIALLIELICYHWRDRDDFYAGGNMFIYFSPEKVKDRLSRGPDFFVVKGVDGTRSRRFWVVWEEDNRYPNVILELLSPTTAKEDRGAKKELYEQTFRTPEYFLYDPEAHQVQGWRLNRRKKYRPIEPDERGWLWSEQLQLWIGTWEGEYTKERGVWPRFYDADGNLVLTKGEAEELHARLEKQRADVEKQRADVEKQRAEAAEATLAQLQARLAELEAQQGKG
jgi:Uma2 family endonuclease